MCLRYLLLFRERFIAELSQLFLFSFNKYFRIVIHLRTLPRSSQCLTPLTPGSTTFRPSKIPNALETRPFVPGLPDLMRYLLLPCPHSICHANTNIFTSPHRTQTFFSAS